MNKTEATAIVVIDDNNCLLDREVAVAKFKITIANRRVNNPFIHFLMVFMFTLSS